MDKQKAIIVDLDGTLCNNKQREHFMTGSPKDWDGFYAGIPDDTVHEWCETIVYNFMKNGFKVLFVSGRPDKYKEMTVQWLRSHAIPYDLLLMRKTGDFREDFVIKQELYQQEIEPKYQVLFTVDDRTQVVSMWRRIGLPCLQCADGNF